MAMTPENNKHQTDGHTARLAQPHARLRDVEHERFEIDGGAGLDTAVYVGNFASYTVSTLADPPVPAARAYAGGHPASTCTTWAKVRVRTRQRADGTSSFLVQRAKPRWKIYA